MNSLMRRTLGSGSSRHLAQFFQAKNSSAPSASLCFHTSPKDFQNINKKAYSDGKNRLGKSFKTIELKEKIEDHDLQSKINHMRKWLTKGHTIRAVISSQHQDTSRTEGIYNNLLKELGSEGKFDSKKIAGKDIRFTVDPITSPTPSDQNSTSNKEK